MDDSFDPFDIPIVPTSFAEPTPITSTLYLGDGDDAGNVERLRSLGIRRVLHCAQSHEIKTYHPPSDDEMLLSPTFYSSAGYPLDDWLCLQLQDNPTENIFDAFEAALHFLRRSPGTPVLVHCAAGVSRSATIVTAFLMAHSQLTLADAAATVKRARHIVSPNAGFVHILRAWEARLATTRRLAGDRSTARRRRASVATASVGTPTNSRPTQRRTGSTTTVRRRQQQQQQQQQGDGNNLRARAAANVAAASSSSSSSAPTSPSSSRLARRARASRRSSLRTVRQASS